MIAACGQGPCRVQLADDVRHVPGQYDVWTDIGFQGTLAVVFNEVEEIVGFLRREVLEIVVLRVALLGDLVGEAPHEYAWVVAVAADEVAQVNLMPIVVEACVIIARLALSPHVKGFVEDEESHVVSKLKELRCGRVVRSAYGVHAEALEYLELALERAEMHCRAYAAHVMVQANAEEFHLAPV